MDYLIAKNKIISMIIPPRKLVLSGGGIRVTAHVGALKTLNDKGYLRFIREYIGVSAGALLSTLFVIGYTIQQIEKLCMELDFSVIRNFDPADALDILENYGVDSGENLEKLVHSVFRIKGVSTDLTFEQAVEKGMPLLRIFATDLNTCSFIEYSAKKTPSTPIIFALRASMCIPLYFNPVQDPHTKHLLVDGGVIANYPIEYLSEEEQKESLGLKFNDVRTQVESHESLIVFLNQLLSASYVSSRISSRHDNRTIVIPCGEYPSWNFEASKEDRKLLYNIGCKAVNDFMKLKRSVNGLRRYSV